MNKNKNLYGPNGRRVERKRRTSGANLCPHCYSFNCDPMTMSKKFLDKVNRRRLAKVCVACGQKQCRCKRKENGDYRTIG